MFCKPEQPEDEYSGYAISAFEAIARRTPWLMDFNSWGYRCMDWSNMTETIEVRLRPRQHAAPVCRRQCAPSMSSHGLPRCRKPAVRKGLDGRLLAALAPAPPRPCRTRAATAA